MKALAFAAMFSVVTAGIPLAVQADQSCNSTAADKKLAGAAKASFLKKCEADAKASCDSQAADKKLAGAAKASFAKKCVSDAVGKP